MGLLLGVVVVAVDPLGFLDRPTSPRLEAGGNSVHHLLTVEERERLRPAKLTDVGPELIVAFHEVGEVGVWQVDEPLGALLLGDLDVMHGYLVTNATRA